MASLFRVTRIIMRACVVAALILGLCFWSGFLLRLVPLHMLLGFIIMICLWIVAIAGATRGETIFGAVGIIWGVLLVWLGIFQASILPGSLHWIIQVLHLFVGLAAVGIAEAIIGRVTRANEGRTTA